MPRSRSPPGGNTALIGGWGRQLSSRRGLGFHAQWRRLDAGGVQRYSALALFVPPDRAGGSRCPPTATLPWWGRLLTATIRGQRGSSREAVEYGPSKDRSWPALALPGLPSKAGVALSADGNTAMVGGPYDSVQTGATWAYIRIGASWSQQGSKVAGFDAVGGAFQGGSVALSADGYTAIVGGPGDNSGAGAAWIFTATGTNWTEQHGKLFGTGALGAARQGNSVYPAPQQS